MSADLSDQPIEPARPARLPVRTLTLIGLGLLAAGYLAIWWLAPLDRDILPGFWPFSLVGLVGAVIASATGVGGGVVFVPAFAFLRESGLYPITASQIVGVSFAIQCFGMSMGSLTWLNRFYRDPATHTEPRHRRLLWRILALVLAPGLAGLLAVQWGLVVSAGLAFLLFKLFSIALGSALLLQLALTREKVGRTALSRTDAFALPLVALAGGAATALFSVGIGELLALYLFLRRFPVDVCVSAAVMASAVSVLSGVIFHLHAGHLVFEILVFAAPAVALGGFLARRFAHWLGAVRLKLATGLWIVLSGISLLAL